MLNMNIKRLYKEFPRQFWIVVAVNFIDSIGGTMLFPFFSLYITQKFNVGMTEAGIVLGLFSISGLVGQVIGGALTDKFGRRKLIIFGLIFSALSTLSLGFVKHYSVLIPLAIFIGLLSDMAGPARSAMSGDILPEHQRQEGFGIMRVVGNLAWIIGPSIGGIVAGKSFLALFIIDAIISCITALLFFLLIPETKPQARPDQKPESFIATFKGYGKVLSNKAFIAFLLAGVLMGIVYNQAYNSLSVYMRDNHGFNTSQYGFLLTASAIIVILFQFSVTRWIKTKAPFIMLAVGTLFYMFGFTMFGFIHQYWLFVLAIVIITMGEMIIVPVQQTVALNFAPADMRGRYMGVFGFVWMIPATIGPGAAGLILDNLNPNLLWYIGGVLCSLSAFAFYLLHFRLGKQERFQPAPKKAESVLT